MFPLFQVITFSTYIYCILLLFSSQYLSPEPQHLSLLGLTDQESSPLPSFLIVFQFCMYVGLLKIAETTLNPFGEDKDDFDVGYIVDRNWQVHNCSHACDTSKPFLLD